MANITRFDPLDELFRGFFVRPVEFSGPAPETPGIRMDVREEGNTYRVHAELPGVHKDDIHVEIEGNQVSITAEVKRHSEAKEGERILRSERYYGKVARSFQLAHEIDDTTAVARYQDGVLELELPKRLLSSNKRLSIQ